jgi:hypothetical protein
MSSLGKRAARQGIYFTAGAMRKTVGLSYEAYAEEKEVA